MSERNYSKMMEDRNKQALIDSKLDELAMHQAEIARLNNELVNITTEGIDSEDRLQQQMVKIVTENTVSNPIEKRINEEMEEIKKIKEDLTKLNQ